MAQHRRTISVIGCGLIGESWAALFLAYGHAVRAWDPSLHTRASFAAKLERPLQQLSSLGHGNNVGRLVIAETMEQALDGSDLIQENAPENIELKRRLYADIEAVASLDTIIASSTSSLTWSDLSPGMRRPERLITAHPFNPPHLIPLVELFGIDQDVLARADAIYRRIGRYPVCLKKDAVGHIANRLTSALWREAVNIVVEGIADVSAVDAALVHGPGLRWSVIGAHMGYHLGGGEGGIRHYLDHLGPSQERRWLTLGNPKLTPEVRALLVDGVSAEANGTSIAELESNRDTALIRMLRAREGEPYDR